ncbi:MAG: hypothetical protein Q8O20_10905 [Sulfuricurvum sp.]|nr:hypothetical protein [Sulfuricurvum sp.]
MENIHKVYIALSSHDKELVKNAFYNNQLIEDICKCSINPVSYSELPKEINNLLEEYLTNLWSLLTTKDAKKNIKLKEQCGNIYEHYCDLFKDKRQIFTVCPVCGIEELLEEYDSCNDENEENQTKAREAYDHYLPKSLYPFMSISFENLIPICHHCNSDYKHKYNTPYDGSHRQKCFFPYSSGNNSIQVNIQSEHILKALSSSNSWFIELNSPNDIQEEIDSWDRIFQIKSRYKNRIKTKEASWKQRLYTEYKHDSSSNTFTLDSFKIKMYRDIQLTDQSSAIVQKSYYDYFLNNLLPSYMAMEEEMNQ